METIYPIAVWDTNHVVLFLLIYPKNALILHEHKPRIRYQVTSQDFEKG